ncbi:MAG TPA: AraC family transcriptional regulator [Rhodocyclaceae bacterium]|nr:AraC family transcriptional regulator [Rhodocyclaceae bacterium]
MEKLFEALRGMRLSGAVFLEAQLTAPWGFHSRVEPEDYGPHMAPPRHLIAYHYITAGCCTIQLEGRAPIPLQRGEIVVLPRNDAHVLASGAGVTPIHAGGVVEHGDAGGLARIRYGGGGEVTRMYCGFLGTNAPYSAALAMLPPLLTVDASASAVGGWIESSFQYAAHESARAPKDAQDMIARLAEFLFLDAVRQYIAAHPREQRAWGSIADAYVGRALTMLHENPTHHWTTETLAAEIGLSRSAFADRFTRAVGEPPMRYLARRKLDQAATLLRESSLSIARIAYDVGYESEAAFNRAFRREYGTPPGTWRRDPASAPPK